jgi:hypothetical protein
LDGFAEDRNGSALYPNLDALDKTEVLRESQRNPGSVVMAYKEFAMAEDPQAHWLRVSGVDIHLGKIFSKNIQRMIL